MKIDNHEYHGKKWMKWAEGKVPWEQALQKDFWSGKNIKNLIRNTLEITYKFIQVIINGELDIKLGQFTEEGLDAI